MNKDILIKTLTKQQELLNLLHEGLQTKILGYVSEEEMVIITDSITKMNAMTEEALKELKNI